MEQFTKNEIETAIASIYHNLECVEEIQQQADYDMKHLYNKEKERLTKLLKKYLKMREEVE